MPSPTPRTTAIPKPSRIRSRLGTTCVPNSEKSHRSWNWTRIVESRGNFGSSACTVHSCQAARIAIGTAISAPITSTRYVRALTAVSSRWEGCQRSTRRSTPTIAKWMADAEEARRERERVHLRRQAVRLGEVQHRWPRPGVPMNSSAVNARISATVDAIRSPVMMYGTALGSVILYSRSRRRDAERAGGVDGDRVDVVDAVHRLDEQRPERAERGEEDLALQGRPQRQEEQRNERGGRDRPQELDRHAERARGELARARGRSRAARRARVASPRPIAQPRTVCAERDPEVGASSSSSTARRSSLLIDGRSRSSIRPPREISSQTARATRIDSTGMSSSAARVVRARAALALGRATGSAAAARSPVADMTDVYTAWSEPVTPPCLVPPTTAGRRPKPPPMLSPAASLLSGPCSQT